jgi:hypothetical protein
MLVLAGVHHLITHVGEPNFERLRAVKQHKAKLLQIVTTSTLWGSGSEAIPPPTSDEESAPAPDSDENASSSSSDSDSDPDAAELRLDSFTWLCPQGGMVHVAADTCDSRPLCCNRFFKVGRYAEGKGLETALSLARPWCPKCLLKLPPAAAKAITEARMEST